MACSHCRSKGLECIRGTGLACGPCGRAKACCNLVGMQLDMEVPGKVSWKTRAKEAKGSVMEVELGVGDVEQMGERIVGVLERLANAIEVQMAATERQSATLEGVIVLGREGLMGMKRTKEIRVEEEEKESDEDEDEETGEETREEDEGGPAADAA